MVKVPPWKPCQCLKLPTLQTLMEYWPDGRMLICLMFARLAYFINREIHPLCDQSHVGFSVVLLDGAFFYLRGIGNVLFLMALFLWLCEGLFSRD